MRIKQIVAAPAGWVTRYHHHDSPDISSFNVALLAIEETEYGDRIVTFSAGNDRELCIPDQAAGNYLGLVFVGAEDAVEVPQQIERRIAEHRVHDDDRMRSIHMRRSGGNRRKRNHGED